MIDSSSREVEDLAGINRVPASNFWPVRQYKALGRLALMET
jgi:hypothetical protein